MLGTSPCIHQLAAKFLTWRRAETLTLFEFDENERNVFLFALELLNLGSELPDLMLAQKWKCTATGSEQLYLNRYRRCRGPGPDRV